MRLWLTVAAAVLLCGASCNREQSSPDKTALLFQRALNERDVDQVYRLIAPETQKLLQKLAALANAQTGGRRQIEPKELLIVGVQRLTPGSKPSSAKVAQQSDDRARVELRQGKALQHTLEMVNVEGRWRVMLPRRLLRPLDPPQPASQPAP